MQASLRFTGLGLLFLLASCGGAGVPEREKQQDTEPRAVKVVVVTLFEIGEDTGDRAGEFQLWKERRTFDEVLPLVNT